MSRPFYAQSQTKFGKFHRSFLYAIACESLYTMLRFRWMWDSITLVATHDILADWTRA